MPTPNFNINISFKLYKCIINEINTITFFSFICGRVSKSTPRCCSPPAGAKVTSTDLPDVLSNLRHNVQRNSRGLYRHEPLVTELSWGKQLEERFPRDTCRFDYIMAADVVYAHPYLQELMETFIHLSSDDITALQSISYHQKMKQIQH